MTVWQMTVWQMAVCQTVVCENEFAGKMDFYEVKLDAKRYSETLLRSKVEAFLRKHPDKRRQDSRIGLLSVEDM